MRVIIMRGIPGSGKSTYASGLPQPNVVVSADDYFLINGEYKFNVNDQARAHAMCLRGYVAAINAWQRPALVVVDNTNILAADLAPYYSLAEAYGCDVKIVRCFVDPEIAMRRNVHDVPASVIWRMYQTLLNERLPAWWKEEFYFTGDAK